MIASKSPLKWDKFGVLNWELKYVEPDENIGQLIPREYFEQYQIDIDFDHHTLDEQTLRVFLNLRINDVENAVPGYRIRIEALGIFDISNTLEMDEAQQQNLHGFATTNLMIGRLRGLLPTLTSQAPFGTYQLPSIDMNDLINQKVEQVSEQNQE